MAMITRVVKKISEDHYSTDDDRYKEFRPYSELAHAVISMACADYAAIHHGKWNLTKQRLRDESRTFFRSKWFAHMDISERFDPDVIMNLIDSRKPDPRKFAQNSARGKAEKEMMI